MTARTYTACADWLSRTPIRACCFRLLFRLLPIVTAVAYLSCAAFLLWKGHLISIQFLVVPALTFLGVTLLRQWLNFPRPYDQLEYAPFLSAEPGKGKSFPSRHTASAAAIALAFCQLSPALGSGFWVLAVMVAASRVVGGAHYIRDVLAGLFLPLLFLPLYLL